jgi:hypothetical protein
MLQRQIVHPLRMLDVLGAMSDGFGFPSLLPKRLRWFHAVGMPQNGK